MFRIVNLWNGRETRQSELVVAEVGSNGVQLSAAAIAINGAPIANPTPIVFYISS